MAEPTSTKEQIVEAAARLIADRGPAHATTRAIAEEAGCSEGSIYRYFPGKHELFLEVFRRWTPEFVQLLDALPGRAGTGRVQETLRELAVSALGFYREKGARAIAMLADPEVLEEHRRYCRTSGVGPRRSIEHVAAYLEGEQRLGRVERRADPEAAARLLLGACYQEALFGAFLGDGVDDPAPLGTRIVDELWRGLAPRGRGARSSRRTDARREGAA